MLVENSGDVIWCIDARTNRFSYVSPSITRVRGLTVDEAAEEPIERAWLPESLEKIRRNFALLATQDSMTDRYEQPCADGSIKIMETTMSAVFDGDGEPVEYVGISRDVSDRSHVEEELRRELDEKELLLSEMNHRVKNNLNMAARYLAFAADKAPDEESSRLFEDSRLRMTTLALIHERLLNQSNIDSIDLGEYLAALAGTIMGSYRIEGRIPELQTAIEPCRMQTQKAAYVGLVVTELLTNAIKYAFPDGGGIILLTTRREDPDNLCVSVRDNGVGLPVDFNLDKANGFGLMIMDGLARQLHARLAFSSPANGGAEFTLTLPL